MKKKKQKPAQPPVWTDGQSNEHFSLYFSTFMNIAVRLALLCMATAGVVLTFIQMYDVPVHTGTVIGQTVFFTVVFNILFMFVKFRFALPALSLIFFLFVRFGNVRFNLGCLLDYLLHYVDGGLLHTAGYASRPAFAVMSRVTYEVQAGIQEGLIFCAIIFALLFAITARGKFIGSILITTIILIIPAIASQNASYVPAITLLVCAMFGLYSIWASQEQSFLKSFSRKNRSKKPPFIPQIHRHSVNGAAAACLALVAVMTAQAILPLSKARDTIDFWGRASDNVIQFFYDVGDLIGGGFSGWGGFTRFNIPQLDTSGYMSGGGVNASGSLSISNPTISQRPALDVILDYNHAPVYLRNGIGTVYDAVRERWNLESRANRMRGFPDNFYPEHEYLVFRQIVNNLGFTADSLIGRQRVDVEYLVRTSHIMLPTSLHMPSYKSDPRFTWRNDAIVEKRGSTNPQTYAWDVLYPRHNMHLGVAIEQVQSQITNMRALTGEEASLYAIAGSFEDYIFIELGEGFGAAEGALRIFVNDYGLTAAEYLHYIALYEEMVYDVYLETTPSETENIQLMIEEVFKRQQWITAEGVVTWGADPDTLSAYDTAFLIEHYFKNGYIFKYSLIVDNHRGDNSFLGNFLHETRTGHCALYATAMTLMLRELGIPARYVTGFVAGGNSTARYGERYQHRILERDLHAWVEVYFSGIGWLPFDPTPPITDYHFLEAETAERAPPPVTTPRVTTPPVTTPPVTAPPGTTTPQVTTPPRITEPGQTPPPFSMPPPHTESRAALTFAALMLAVAVLLAAGIAAAVVMFLKGITRAERRRLAKYADLNEGAAAREAYRFMLKLLKMEGLTALAGETPVKFAARVDEEFCMGVLNPVIGAILKLEFSREELNAAEYAALSRTVKSVYRQVVTEQRKLKRLARRIAALDIIK